MTRPLPALAELVRQRTGFCLPPGRSAALQAAVRRAAPELDEAGFVAAVADPLRGRELMDRLIDEVTVQETSFVRDRDQLDLIPWHGLQREAGSAGTGVIRVWSAGCASGEEPYTLALLASEAFAPATAPVDVLGTDISGAALRAAAAGRYRERAVRGLDGVLRRRYLKRQPDGHFLVSEQLRGLARFRRHNLASDPIPPIGEPGFDLVVCRNVLIYFEPVLVARVIGLLERSLNPGGLLVLGAADALQRTAAFRAAPAGSGAIRAVGRTRNARGSQPARGLRGAQGREGTAYAIPGPVPREDAHQPVPRHTRDQAEAGQPRDHRAGGHRAGNHKAGNHKAAGGRVAGQRERRLTAALDAAGRGDRDDALGHISSLLADDPLDADAHFVHGLVALEAGDPAGAADALRRALYTDPTYTLAAFTLGRAYDALSDWMAARRAYAQALRTLDPGDRRHELMLQQVDLGDIAAACAARLEGES